MFTKGQKVMHEIGTQLKSCSTFEALNKGAQTALQMGGTFSAKDVCELLKIASVAIFNADQKKEMNDAVNSQVKKMREMVQNELKEALERAERAENVAKHEYERARDEIVEELRYYKEKTEESQEKAEKLENLEGSVHPEIWDAICSMIPGERLTFAEAYEVAEKIRNCGRFDASQLKMAI